jgi:hypothetical protein
MKSISKIGMAMTFLLSYTVCSAQIKNAQVESVKILGNCEMCKKTIEKAGNVLNVAEVNWDKNTKMAILTYDANKTNQDEILKRIALYGYDSDIYLAPSDVYAKLSDCCQYERKAVVTAKTNTTKQVGDAKMDLKIEIVEHKQEVVAEKKQDVDSWTVLFDHYFALKDALVKTDGNTASSKANMFLTAIGEVKMEKLSSTQHNVWMKIQKDLAFDAEHIAETKEASHQRDHFITLSKNMYDLIKVSKQETLTYYQFCPMANKGKGAHWLSKDNTIKNPYFGSKMLGCGKTIELIN